MRFLILCSFLLCAACTIKAGVIPEGSNPDVFGRYNEGGFSMIDGRIGSEKMQIPDFADKLCKDRGFTAGYSGYEIDRFETQQNTTFIIQLENNKYRDIKVWCNQARK